MFTSLGKKAFKLLLSFRSLIKVYHHELPSLCTAAPPLKKIGKERLWFTVDNRVQRPRDFFRNVWKMI